MREETAATIRASTLRLRQMGLSDAQITRFGNAAEPPANLLLGNAGGTLWVYAELYDYEAGLVHPGAQARAHDAQQPCLRLSPKAACARSTPY